MAPNQPALANYFASLFLLRNFSFRFVSFAFRINGTRCSRAVFMSCALTGRDDQKEFGLQIATTFLQKTCASTRRFTPHTSIIPRSLAIGMAVLELPSDRPELQISQVLTGQSLHSLASSLSKFRRTGLAANGT